MLRTFGFASGLNTGLRNVMGRAFPRRLQNPDREKLESLSRHHPDSFAKHQLTSLTCGQLSVFCT
jgi:hypothetical protein